MSTQSRRPVRLHQSALSPTMSPHAISRSTRVIWLPHKHIRLGRRFKPIIQDCPTDVGRIVYAEVHRGMSGKEAMQTHDFTGRTVLLTGGLGSLGRAQAEAFVAAGARLLLLDRPDHDRIEEIVALLRAKGKGDIRYIGQDLGDLEGSRETVAALDREVGGVEILI